VTELILTAEQSELVAPLIRQHCEQGKNALFVSTIGPDICNGQSVWRWQLTTLSRKTAQKLLKIIRESSDGVATAVQEGL
jgi:hypothetical protein